MTKKRDRRPASEWAELVSAWRASGESQRVFAEEQGVNASTLASWSRKLGSGGGSRRPKRRHRRERSTSTFAQVQVAETGPAPSPTVVHVTTPTGYVVRVMGAVDVAALRVVLDEVSRC